MSKRERIVCSRHIGANLSGKKEQTIGFAIVVQTEMYPLRRANKKDYPIWWSFLVKQIA